MVRRLCWQLFAALAALLALTTPAFAGGWAVVTLDSLPAEIQAGKTMRLGFMVRQHGTMPIDTTRLGGTSMLPIFSARNTTTGQTIQATARTEGRLGHFVVDVAFPQAGSWEIEITPPPFEGTRLGVFTVAAATTTASSQQGSLSIAAAFADRSARLWLSTVLVLVIALGLTAFVQREALARLAGRNPRSPRPIDESQGVGRLS